MMTKADVTAMIRAAKREKGITWAAIAGATGGARRHAQDAEHAPYQLAVPGPSRHAENRVDRRSPKRK